MQGLSVLHYYPKFNILLLQHDTRFQNITKMINVSNLRLEL